MTISTLLPATALDYLFLNISLLISLILQAVMMRLALTTPHIRLGGSIFWSRRISLTPKTSHKELFQNSTNNTASFKMRPKCRTIGMFGFSLHLCVYAGFCARFVALKHTAVDINNDALPIMRANNNH